MHTRFIAAAGLAVLALAGCSDDPLAVENENNPDVERAYGTTVGVETIISRVFQQMHQAQYGSSDALWPQTTVMSFESYASVANFGMNARAQLPRGAPIDNSRGNNVAAGNFRDYDQLTRNARSAATAISALNRFNAAGATIGTAARDARAKSFAYFSLGFALGYLGLFYDSAAVVTPKLADSSFALGTIVVPPYSAYSAVVDTAIIMLDSALAIATSPAAAGTGGWPIPTTWMAQSAPIPLDRWQRIIRSYRARFRAGVARSPAERETVNWTAVVDDAATGLTDDLVVQLSPAAGWTNSFIQTAATPGGWHQMPYFFIGMADTSGAYDNWLATPLGNRTPFLIQTPDRRFPRGATRAAQQAFVSPTVPDSGVYFRNRPTGQDTPGDAWGTSQYDNFRFYPIRNASGNGPFPIMTKAEVDMLAAEGYVRTSRVPQAAALIDVYRVRNNLAPLGGIADLATPVPGGTACVPRVPAPPTFTSTVCGTLFDALKYEKRLETAFTGYGQWFIDGRGWGDLPQGTQTQWPVPYQERDARGLPFYIIDVPAATNNYGF